METIKAGDQVRCTSTSGWFLIDAVKKPKLGDFYTVTSVDGNYISLEGFDKSDFWHIRNFEVQKSVIRKLAESFLNSLIEEKPEYERVFRLDANF